jgi:hypothetical protein
MMSKSDKNISQIKHWRGFRINVGWKKRSVSTITSGAFDSGGNAALFPPYDFFGFRLVRLGGTLILIFS